MNSAVLISPESPYSTDAVCLMEELSACLESITGSGGTSSFDPRDVCGSRSLFIVARNLRGEPVGCGAFRPVDESAAELKRMYARQRGKGIGSQLITYLEEQASLLGYEFLRLETRRCNASAVSFYLRSGYRPIPNYGRYQDRPEAICFEKSIKLYK